MDDDRHDRYYGGDFSEGLSDEVGNAFAETYYETYLKNYRSPFSEECLKPAPRGKLLAKI